MRTGRLRRRSRAARPSLRVDRTSLPATTGRDGWPPNGAPQGAREQDPAYRPTRPRRPPRRWAAVRSRPNEQRKRSREFSGVLGFAGRPTAQGRPGTRPFRPTVDPLARDASCTCFQAAGGGWPQPRLAGTSFVGVRPRPALMMSGCRRGCRHGVFTWHALAGGCTSTPARLLALLRTYGPGVTRLGRSTKALLAHGCPGRAGTTEPKGRETRWLRS